jgi:hypothetical protein
MMRREQLIRSDAPLHTSRDRNRSATVPIVVPLNRIRAKDATPLINLIQGRARIDARLVTSED